MGEAAQFFTRSLMMGLDSAVRKPEFAEPTAEDIENMPYHEAVEFLKKRDVIKKVDYDKLSDKMKFRAFTASRINDGKLLEKLNAQMLANVNGGKGLKDFLSLTKTDILDKIGMGPNQGWYWETVYRTNAQTAYNVGRAMGFEADKPLALQFVGIDDARQTDVCHSLSGIVRPYGDPFWQSHFPPLHFNCRSTLRAIYDEAELPEEWSGLDEAESPAKGFGSYPLDSDNWWKELDSQVRQAKQFGVQGEIEAAKVALGVEKANIQNDVALFNSQKTREILEKQTPVKPEILNRVKKAFERMGLSITQNREIDEYLERTGREATILSSGDILMHTKISASGLFEELIHFAQIKKYGPNISESQNCLCEIKAKKKLLRNVKCYGITDYEVGIIKQSIEFYEEKLRTLNGGS